VRRDLPCALATYETLRRPRVEHNITVSGQIARGTHSTAHARPATTAPRPGDEELIRHLEWDTDVWTLR
jgi:hypothetical protein